MAVVHSTPAGVGGLGIQSANALADLAEVADRVLAVGRGWEAAEAPPQNLCFQEIHNGVSAFARRYSPLRWYTGRLQFLNDVRLGKAAARAVGVARPDLCYCFTQVGLETFRWANRVGVPAILESPNGHLRNFRAVYWREARRFGAGGYLGHPTPAMVERVEEEYARADVIRVSSNWAKDSLTARGIPPEKVVVIAQRPSARGYKPAQRQLPPEGRFRVCFVGTLDLRKGFVYLLRAARLFGPDRISLRLVGSTVDRFTRRLLNRESAGLEVKVAPGSPIDGLHWAELFVLPTLEDGSPFALVEAMAAGVPAVVTEACGNANLVQQGESGWIIPSADEHVLWSALEEAHARRTTLPGMGRLGRAVWERLAERSNADALRALLEQARARTRRRGL